MSSINFDALQAKRPDLEPVWEQFAHWAEEHPNRRIIDPRAIARWVSGVSAYDLLVACSVLVELGLYTPAFMLESNTGQLVGKPYNSPAEIPETMFGGFEEAVRKSDGRVVAVFVERRKGA